MAKKTIELDGKELRQILCEYFDLPLKFYTPVLTVEKNPNLYYKDNEEHKNYKFTLVSE